MANCREFLRRRRLCSSIPSVCKRTMFADLKAMEDYLRHTYTFIICLIPALWCNLIFNHKIAIHMISFLPVPCQPYDEMSLSSTLLSSNEQHAMANNYGEISNMFAFLLGGQLYCSIHIYLNSLHWHSLLDQGVHNYKELILHHWVSIGQVKTCPIYVTGVLMQKCALDSFLTGPILKSVYYRAPRQYQ